MKQAVFNIPNMQSTHCQTRVSMAINGIAGVQIQKLEAGRLTVAMEEENKRDELVMAIEKAGYSISATGDNTSSACESSCCSI